MNLNVEKEQKVQSGDSRDFPARESVAGGGQKTGENGNKKWRGCFFVGRLKCVSAGIGERYEILDAVSSHNGGQLIDHAILPEKREDDLPQFTGGDFVVGFYPKKNPARLILNKSPNAAVQVLEWASIDQSKDGFGAVEYFSKRRSGIVGAGFKSILGNSTYPGNIIIRDHDVYLKGFEHVGDREIRYSNVSRYVKDVQWLRRDNQWIEVDFENNRVGLLIPRPRPKNSWLYYRDDRKHPVLDCDGWLALQEENMKQVSKGAELVKGELGSALTEEQRSMMAAIDRAAEEHGVVLPSREGDFVTSFPAAQGISEQKRHEKELRLAEMREKADKDNKARLDAVRERTMAIIAKREAFAPRKSDPVEHSSPKSGLMVMPESLMVHDEATDKNERFAIPQNQVQEDATVDPIAEEQRWDKDELDFLKSFESYVLQCGFKYDIADLVRLHTSVKCFMCTLLAGEPGTGKSSLAELYMRALAGKEGEEGAKEEPFKVFVNPAWMEPADLLGYENRHEDGRLNFVPAANHFVDYIREPICSDEKVRIACFEEINLACVEHYFSDFVQIISQRGGKISGCRENENGKDLQVSEDLRIVGTLNSDETTRALSPRFLNRCNSIELECQNEMVKQMLHDAAEGQEPPAPKPFPWTQRQITNNDFHKWRKYAEKRSANYVDNYKKTVVGVLDKLSEKKDGSVSLLSAAGLSLAGRMVADLFTYVRNRPPYIGGKEAFLSEDDRQLMALDEFLAQRLFYSANPTPGTIDGIKSIIETLKTQGLNRSSSVLSKKADEFKALTGML